MKIFYFGELIEDTENPEIKKRQSRKETTVSAAGETKQMKMQFEDKADQEGGYMQSIGELLKDVDMNLVRQPADRPTHLRRQQTT